MSEVTIIQRLLLTHDNSRSHIITISFFFMKSSNSNKATASDQPRWFAMAVILIMIIITCEGRIVERSLKRDTYYYTKAAKTKAAKAVSYQTKSTKHVHSMETNAHNMMNEYTKAGKDEIGVDSKSSKARVDHAHSMSMGGVSYETKAAKTKAAKGDSHFSFFHHGSTDGALDVELNATAVNATATTDEATTATPDAVVSDRAPLTAGREEEEEEGSSNSGHVLSRRNLTFLVSSASALHFLICM